ncbi:MAG: hypothetical protein JWM46_635 [Candidatus Kaiserbacteria bacterium]|nr:hypothetical protein [Candidatus Kaiserbacteria bacterium]
MKSEPIIQILIAAVVLLALGEAYLVHDNAQLRHVASVAGIGQFPTGVTTSPITGSSTVAGPIAPSNILATIVGTITANNDSQFILSAGIVTKTISIDSSTTIVMQGKLKDSAQYADDMEAFRASSMKLAEDLSKNRAALQSLIAPSSHVETSIHASQITAGSIASVYYTIVGGEAHAFKIIVMSAGTN